MTPIFRFLLHTFEDEEFFTQCHAYGDRYTGLTTHNNHINARQLIFSMKKPKDALDKHKK